MPQLNSADYCTRMGEEGKSGTFWRDCFVELLSTFLLVAGTLYLWVGLARGAAGDIGNLQMLWIQVAVGMVCIWVAVNYGLGDYGGAHSNSAITFACLVRAEISLLKALIYWIMQAAGAIAAAFFVYALDGETMDNMGYGQTLVYPGIVWWKGLLIEVWITLVLCLAFLASFNIHRKGYVILSSLPVGLALGHGTIIGLLATGASMNPARSLASAVLASVLGDGDAWADHWIYWVGPIGGALLAAIFHWIFDSVDHPTEGVYGKQRPYVQAGTNGGHREVLTADNNAVFNVNDTSNHVSGNGFVSAYSQPPPMQYTKY